MGATVRQYMNPHIVYLQEGERAEIALQPILDFGLTTVPVLDEDHRPLGVVSLRNLVDPHKREQRITELVVAIGVNDSIANAALRLANANLHHLVVLDDTGRAVGILSSVDIVRALVGLPAKHPAAIDAFDREAAVAPHVVVAR
jgi:CBS-domain-containing membrane protein